MRAVCYILYPNPTEKMKEGLKTVIDWWAASKKLLGDIRLLDTMRKYDKENISDKIINNLT